MESVLTRLRHSGNAVAREGRTFVERTGNALDSFVTSTREAGRGLGHGLGREVRDWGEYVKDGGRQAREEAYTLTQRREAERRALQRMEDGLDWLGDRIGTRLDTLETEIATARALQEPDPVEPFPGYDALKARDVVAQVETLTEAERRAVLVYELEHKGRSTIVRALQVTQPTA